EAEAEVAEPTPEEAEIPEWLGELQPPEVKEVGGPHVAEAEGEMLSGDDALAWLESLAAGKEDELRAQAEAERRARVDEIMGRTPARPPEEEAPLEAEAEVAEPTPEEAEIPEWLGELQPPEVKEVGGPHVAEAEAIEALEEVEEEAEAAAMAEEEEAFFGWSGFGLTPPETEPEVVVEEEEWVKSFGFTSFEEDEAEGAEAEEEPILFEEAQPIEEPRTARPAEATVEPEPEVPTEEPEGAPEAPEEEIPAVVMEEEAIAAKPKPEVLPRVKDLQTYVAYVEEHQDDYQARLKLARALWNSGSVDEAIEHYVRLIRNNELLDQVIEDLQSWAREQPEDPRTLQTLGDAYMKEGNLDQALNAYRRAMSLF
ncbi:MAG: tetratricopeptide repeat protein, partial [Anaerolineae bacterium]